MHVFQKVFSISQSHRRDAGPNTLPTYRKRIFMLIPQKIFLVTMSHQETIKNIVPEEAVKKIKNIPIKQWYNATLSG